MANEVKRWWVSIQDQDGRIVRRDVERLCLAGPEPEPEGYEVFIEVMPVEDHDRIVAEKDAEIASLKAQLSMTNSNWPHEKGLHEIIARQAKVIEKLTEQRNRAADRHHRQSLAKYREKIAQFEAEITAIEQGEGT